MQSSIVSTDILDLGTRQNDNEQRRAASGGTAGLCPTEMMLGIPGAFDIPNVADVSFFFTFFHLLLLFKQTKIEEMNKNQNLTLRFSLSCG
jgi:hypothetical protein